MVSSTQLGTYRYEPVPTFNKLKVFLIATSKPRSITPAVPYPSRAFLPFIGWFERRDECVRSGPSH